ncbi:MAG: histidine phosphatase family protein [Lachnospiraceae bacterium]|nr:histidine phosphatase family protein [Candidatus Equihabitans merdae]
MQIMIIRHADPDYTIDSLTPKGHREAALLSKRFAEIVKNEITPAGYYVSPLGRAQLTAKYCLDPLGIVAEEKWWLREFHALINRPDVKDRRKVTWDWLPEDWANDERFYQYDHWFEHEVMTEAHVKEEYDAVTGNLDQLLAEHGYVRDGHLYRPEKPNNDTIIFFCHFGLECVLLSHLLNISPMQLWHGTVAAPSSITTLVTEERRQGIASWRMLRFGSIDHLVMGNELPSTHARFCECYMNEEERHD